MIKYNGPTGEEIINPSEEFLYDIFFCKNQNYWKRGYMSREKAYNLIRSFIQKKDFDNEWVDLYNIEFDYDF